MNSNDHSVNNMDFISTDKESDTDIITSLESFEFGDFHENLSEISSEICQDFWKPDIDYDDWSSILSKVPEIVDAIFGPDLSPPNTSLEEDLTSEENESSIDKDPVLFSESGSMLWKKYSEFQDSNLLSWETSYTRQMFFMSLEIPMNLDKITNTYKKPENKSISSIKTTSCPPFDLAVKDESTTKDYSTLPDFDTQMARIFYLKSDEALSNLSLILLKSHLLELEIIQEKSKKYLEYWTAQKESIESDKQAFEKVIESVVQHTKQQRIEHIKKILFHKKKHKQISQKSR